MGGGRDVFVGIWHGRVLAEAVVSDNGLQVVALEALLELRGRAGLLLLFGAVQLALRVRTRRWEGVQRGLRRLCSERALLAALAYAVQQVGVHLFQ